MASRLPFHIAMIFFFLFFFKGCIMPEVSTNYITSKKLYTLRSLEVAIMPFMAQELTESEIEDILEEIVDNLSYKGLLKKIILASETEIIKKKNDEMRGNSLAYYIPSRIMYKEIDNDLLEKWQSCWEGYLKHKKIDTNILKEICDKMGVTSILQFAVTDVRKTKSAHRKTIAETEAEIWYTLFFNDGEILLVGKSIGSQANAWSGQLQPKPIEAIEPAVDDILDKIPF